jgi:AsmA protein
VYSLTKARVALEGMALAGDFSVDTRHGDLFKANLASISAYGGSGKGTLTLDPSGTAPTLRETLEMSGVRTEQILSQIMGIAKVSASGAVQLDLSARGGSENEIIASLSGRGSIDLSNGTISGADLGAVARLLKSTAGLLSGAVGSGARTEFSSLACSFMVENGVLRTNDLRMAGSGLNMTGAGTVNLATRQVAFHLVPKAEIGVAGVNLIDIGIPFYVNGTLDDPSFAPDPAGIAKGVIGGVVSGVAGAVKNTATGIVDVPVDAVKSLLGR